MIKFHLISIFNLLKIYFLISLSKITQRKTILFYHAQKRTILTHSFYIEKIFNNYPERYKVIFAYNSETSLKKNYLQIKERYLKFIFGLDFFISNNICFTLPTNENKIYIHHNLYDDPWVKKSNEKKIYLTLLKYDFIFVGTKISSDQLYKTFKKNRIKNHPKIYDIGYPRLDYLLSNNKIYEKKKDSILIAPTGIDGFPKLTIIKKLDKIVHQLLNLNYKVILRPHPRDKKNKTFIYLKNKYSEYENFNFDESDDYAKVYKSAKIMITDISGTAYTFAFYTLSPVIFISTNEKEINKNYSKYNFYLDRNKIGKVIYNLDKINITIKNLLKNKNRFKQNIIRLRKRVKYLKKSKIEIRKFILKSK